MAMLYPLSDPRRAALAALVPLDGVSHTAQADGDWSDSATWDGGSVPGPGARVYIPAARTISYDVTGTPPSLKWIRLEGTLSARRGLALQMKVDTFITDLGSVLDFGTKASPLGAGSSLLVTFADNGDLDPAVDMAMIGRGLITLGKVDIHGTEKSSWHYIENSLAIGATSLTLSTIPTGWAVGDTIVLGGAHWAGYYRDGGSNIMHDPETEERVITSISGATIGWSGGLTYARPVGVLGQKIQCGNLTRNIKFQTEGGATSEVWHRGHIMFMHNPDVRVHYAQADWVGRTRKNTYKNDPAYIEAKDAFEFGAGLAADSNVKGRYAWHLHKTGVDNYTPGEVPEFVGLSAAHTPGWLFTHHDTAAHFHDCLAYDAGGAGFVSESGNETGAWTNCLAMKMVASRWTTSKLGDNHNNGYDIAMTGCGFDNHSRLVQINDCSANSCTTGLNWFHRGREDAPPYDGVIPFNASETEIPVLWGFIATGVGINKHPILHIERPVAIACFIGVHIEKANMKQDHDYPTIINQASVYSFERDGIAASYTGHYGWLDARVEGVPAGMEHPSMLNGETGAKAGTNSHAQQFIRPTIHKVAHAFDVGTNYDSGTAGSYTYEQLAVFRDHHVVEPTLTSITSTDYVQDAFYGAGDAAIKHATSPAPALSLANFAWSISEFSLNGITYTVDVTDSAGTVVFPQHPEAVLARTEFIRGCISRYGYWKDGADDRYVYVPLAFHDRLNPLEKTEIFAFQLKFDKTRTDNQIGTDNGYLTDPAPELHVDFFRPPVHGVIRPKSGSPGVYNYHPFIGFNGTESLTYWMTDGRGTVEKRTTTVNAANTNYPDAVEIDLSGGPVVPMLRPDMSFVVDMSA